MSLTPEEVAAMAQADVDETAPRLPVMALKSVDAWGVAPDGSEALIKVTTASQEFQIHAAYQTLVDLIIAAQAARAKASQNAAGAGVELASATHIEKFMVGHANAAAGVLLVLNAGTPHETIFSIPPEDAIDMGKLLMAEGAKRRNLAKAIATPPRKKLILPGMN